MADTIRYVNTASTAGGNGTTNNIFGPNKAYASLNEWEANEQATVSAGDRHIVNCSGTAADTTKTIIDGWTITDANALRLLGDNDTGVFSSSHYRLDASDGFDFILVNLEDNVDLDNMQISNTGATQAGGYDDQGGGTGTISNSIFIANSDESCLELDTLNANAVRDVYNCLMYNGKDGIFSGFPASGVTLSIYNCTLVNCGTGARLNSVPTLTIKNCLSDNSTTADYNVTGGGTTANNVSSDATSPDGASYQNKTFTFEDSANDDYHLASGDTGAIGNGVGPASDSNVPTTDIDGDARSGTTCDCGYDEFVSAGGSVIPVFVNSYKRRR
jgi:hypothetical protein